MPEIENEDFDFAAEGTRFWTRETLQQVVERVLGRRHFIVVSNREPYVHRLEGEEILCERPISGMVTALEPVMRVCGGSWVAHGSGNADRDVVDAHDRIAVPPEHPLYTLRRLWLSKRDEDGYYYGCANRALWPLCHIAYHRPVSRPFPISLDIDALSEKAESEDTAKRMAWLRRQLRLEQQRVVLGVDRIDYTKGIPERLRAFDRLLESHPEYAGKLCLVQLASPSRTRLRDYQTLARDIEALVEEINWKYAQARWTPIIYRKDSHSADDLVAFYRLADVCIVSALHDGMNLVAKEYIAARTDNDGVLVLSRFAGAARELEHSVQINPYATDGVAAALHQALCMEETERRTRMMALRQTVARNNIYRWAGKIVSELGRIAGRRRLEAAA